MVRPPRTVLGGALLGLLSAWLPAVCALSASDFFVHSLPGAPPGPLLKMHAGHLPVDEAHHGNLFFWHFQNRHIGDRQRTVIWLNGGPGCSSMDGALMEIGPYRVRDGGQLEYNDGSWDEFANILFVDNPVGTGFSYVDTDSYVHELQEMADEFVTFLERWFDVFPEYEHDDLYIAGESYAGQHIPYIANAILSRNAAAATDRHWNIKGLLIGNGWISPTAQYPGYLQYAYKKGLIQGGSEAAKIIESQQAVCTSKLTAGGMDHVDTPECEAILQQILRLTVDTNAPADQRCLNMYDVRLRDSYSSCGMNWPPDLVHVTPYLRQSALLSALHVNPDKATGWTECSGAVSSNFRARNSAPAITLLPKLLEAGIPLTLFSGAEDLICNHVGTEELINNMVWSGGKGFETSGTDGTWAPRRDWTFEGEAAGIYQEARNLTYILFYNSSHMVPFDYPRRTRDMLDRFMGVDIGSIGGKPSDSRIDGSKAGPETSVGGHPNSTIAEEVEKEKLLQAKWDAYYRSGEVALVIVILAAGAWFWFVYRERSAMKGYQGVWGGPGVIGSGIRDMVSGAGRLGSFAFQGGVLGRGKRDLEAADFDEAELDEMEDEDERGPKAKKGGQARQGNGRSYDMGGLVSDEESDDDDGDVTRAGKAPRR